MHPGVSRGRAAAAIPGLLAAWIPVGTFFHAAFLRFGSSSGGAVFAGALALYTLARQGTLALRDQARRWALAQPVTAAALLADIFIAALR